MRGYDGPLRRGKGENQGRRNVNDHEELRQRAQRRYAGIASGAASSREREPGRLEPIEQAKSLGYTEAELSHVPAGAIMGMGCGNPTALADLRPGETVLDVGCGGGLDAFLAANAVGKTGHVFGVDATPQMIEKARENAQAGGYDNTTFEQGEVEHLPLKEGCVDVVISNCVLNHCPDKRAAFEEILRVLKPGGRMHLTDLVTCGEFPRVVFGDPVWGAWLAVASAGQEYLDGIRQAGFRDIHISSQGPFGMAEADPRLAGRIENIRAVARK